MERKIDQFYAKGKRDCNALVEAVLYENDAIVATADLDKITERQLLAALERTYPDHAFTATACGTDADGHWLADGKPKGFPAKES
jgi:fructose-1,6-bisphosphatase/inositol monophosphatase family enzyme